MKVNALIIGAAKAGTTSLASWLDEHPACCMSRPKETMFFGADRLFSKGPDWYHAEFFNTQDPADIYCDATPAYSNRDRHPGVPQRVYNYNPDMKLVYMIRHPMRRVVSAWQMFAMANEGNSDPVLENAVRKAKLGFRQYLCDEAIFQNAVSTSKYRYQLDAWLEYFPVGQVKLMFLEELEHDEKGVMTDLCCFLQISPEHFLHADLGRKNTKDARNQVSMIRKKFVGSHLGQVAKAIIPKGALKALANSRLGKSPVEIPKPSWDPELRSRFVEEIEDDLHAFLALAGRDISYYPLTPTVKIQTDRLPSD